MTSLDSLKVRRVSAHDTGVYVLWCFLVQREQLIGSNEQVWLAQRSKFLMRCGGVQVLGPEGLNEASECGSKCQGRNQRECWRNETLVKGFGRCGVLLVLRYRLVGLKEEHRW